MEAQATEIVTENNTDRSISNQAVLRNQRESDTAMIIDSWLRSGLQYPIFATDVGRPPLRLKAPPPLLLAQHRTFPQKVLTSSSAHALARPEDEHGVLYPSSAGVA